MLSGALKNWKERKSSAACPVQIFARKEND